MKYNQLKQKCFKPNMMRGEDNGKHAGRKLPGCIEVNKYRFVGVCKQIIKRGKCLFLCLNLQNTISKNAGQFAIKLFQKQKSSTGLSAKHEWTCVSILKAVVYQFNNHLEYQE